LNIEEAKKLLRLDEQIDSDEIKKAYTDRVKEIKNDPDFDAKILDFNIARDVLLAFTHQSRDLVPVLAKELAQISAKQQSALRLIEAKDEVRHSLRVIGNRTTSRIRHRRDMTAFLGIMAAGVAFAKENLEEFAALFPDVSVLSPTLFLASAMLGFMAFMTNQRASRVLEAIEEVNTTLTRERAVLRVLSAVFGPETSLSEKEFSRRVVDQVQSLTGSRGEEKQSAVKEALELYASIGLLPLPVEVRLDQSFYDGYLDFLLKTDYVSISGVRGEELFVSRTF